MDEAFGIGASRGSVINESLIYLSYHTIDLAYAFRLSTLLLRYYRKVWLDRFEIDLVEDWSAKLREARELATGVIVVVSDDYVESPYCRAEFEYFQARGLPLTAVIPRDFSPELIAELRFSDWIDFRRWFHDPKDLSVANLLSQVPQSEAVAQTGERLDTLRGFIHEAALALAQMPTSYASLRNSDGQGADEIRPRLIQPSMLEDWDFIGETRGSSAPVQNLLEWSRAEPQFILRGPAGGGKTYFARLLALQQAHSAIRAEDEAVPVWLDLAQWDERAATLDDFIESQWKLLTYWRHWLDERQTLIILDNYSEFAARQPAQSAAVTAWIEANPDQRFIVLADLRPEAPPNLPALRLDALNESRALSFASGWLTLEQQNSFRAILKRKSAVIENSQLDHLALGVELMSADRALAFNQWHVDPMPALIELRSGQTRAASRELDKTQLLDGLRQLAWSMTNADGCRSIARDSAVSRAIDPRVIDRALELGLLEESGTTLRFQSGVFQWRLAAWTLKEAGIASQLRAPEFAAGQGRVPSRWDQPALALVDSLAEDNRRQAIEEIAEIDPFIAAMCLRRHPDLHRECQETLIKSLVRLCAREAAAQSAFGAAIDRLPDANRAAELLIGLLGKFDNARQLWLWREIRALPLDLPASFTKLARDIERESPESVAEQLSPYDAALSLAWLVKLTDHPEAELRRNAIWMLGELKYLPTAIFLMACLEDDDRGEHEAIVQALMNFAHSGLQARLLRWSQDNRRHRPALIKELARHKRLATSRLLALADARRLTLNSEFYDIVADADEADIAIGLAQIAAESIDLPARLESAIRARVDAAELRDRLAKAIRHRPNREGFQQLLEVLVRVLSDPPAPTISAGSHVEALLYGKPLFDDAAAQAQATPAAPLPEDVLVQLRYSDPKRRGEALKSLTDRPAAVALPHLLEAAHDEDSLVRLTACQCLARYENEEAARKAVFAALADPDGAVVDAATTLLKAMNSLDCASLLDLLESENATAAAAAIDLLSHARYTPAAGDLRQLIEDERAPPNRTTTIGQLARAALERIDSPQRDGDESPTAPEAVVGSEGESAPSGFSDEEKIERTLKVLRDDDWGRTQKAAKFLRRFARHLRGGENAAVLRLLCDSLSDDNWSARWACAEALALLRDRAAIPALSARLTDPSWIVQVAVVRALMELGATGLRDELASLLRSDRKALREASAEALGVIGEAEALPALRERLKRDADEFVRLAALKAIDRIRPEDARAHLELALSDLSVSLRHYALQRLAPQMTEADLPILKLLLDDRERPPGEDESIAEIAIRTVARIESEETGARADVVAPAEERASL